MNDVGLATAKMLIPKKWESGWEGKLISTTNIFYPNCKKRTISLDSSSPTYVHICGGAK